MVRQPGPLRPVSQNRMIIFWPTHRFGFTLKKIKFGEETQSNLFTLSCIDKMVIHTRATSQQHAIVGNELICKSGDLNAHPFRDIVTTCVLVLPVPRQSSLFTAALPSRSFHCTNYQCLSHSSTPFSLSAIPLLPDSHTSLTCTAASQWRRSAWLVHGWCMAGAWSEGGEGVSPQ